MEETKKSRKMVIKLGGGGGVVGAVLLLGGALATAAFASAFVLGQKRRSSDKDHRGRHQNSSPEIDEKISKGAKEEAELEKDSTIHSLKVDDKPKVESDSEKLGDADAIFDDGFVIVKEEIPLLAKNEGKDKVEFTQNDVYSKKSTNLGQVCIEDGSAERESHGDGEIDTTGCKEAAEVQAQVCHDQEDTRADNGVEGDQIDDKHVNIELNMKKKKKKEFVVLCNGNGEIEEEKAVNGCLLNLSPQNIVPVQFDTKNNVGTVKHGENELNENGALVQDPDSQAEEVHEDDEEVEQELVDEDDAESAEVIENTSSVHISAAMDHDVDRNKELNDLSNEESLERRGDSALWQAEWPKASSVALQKVKLVSYEVGGKVQEDKYAVEMGMLKDHQMGSTRLRMMVWTLSVLSSLSCSWFFDLSFAKLCLVLFLTVFLLEIYGYPLLSHQQAW